MRFPLLILLIAIFSISLTSAAIIITPTQTEIDAVIGSLVQFQLNLNSTYNMSLYNLSFTQVPCLSFPKIQELPQHSAGNILITGVIEESCAGLKTSTLKGFYSDTMDSTPQTHNLYIEDTQFNPNSMSIKKDDTIIFHNMLGYEVIITSQEFTRTIPSGQSTSIQFQNIGMLPIQQSTLGYWINLDIQNRTSLGLIYNPEFDTQVSFNINPYFNQTDISASFLESNLTVEYGAEGEALLEVKNIGSETARLVLLSNHGWSLSYSKNNFNIEPSSSSFVVIKFTPELTNTSETNQTYEIPISISGKNFPSSEIILKVNVPYEDYSVNKTYTREEYEKIRSDLMAIIKSMQSQQAVQDCAYPQDYYVGINYSWKDVLSMKDTDASQNDRLGQIDGVLQKMTELMDSMQKSVDTYNYMLNDTNYKLDKTKEDFRSTTSINKTMTIVVLIIIIAGVVLALIYLQRKSKRRSGDIYEYKERK
jgi:hypothetical protein